MPKSKLISPHNQDPVCKSARPRKKACICPPPTPSRYVPLTVLVKLGSIAVHAEEMLSPKGHPFDQDALESLLIDPEITTWIKSMADLLPVKR